MYYFYRIGDYSSDYPKWLKKFMKKGIVSQVEPTAITNVCKVKYKGKITYLYDGDMFLWDKNHPRELKIVYVTNYINEKLKIKTVKR